MLYSQVKFYNLFYVSAFNGAMAARLDRVGLTAVVPETVLILSLLLPIVCIILPQTAVAQGQGKIEEFGVLLFG